MTRTPLFSRLMAGIVSVILLTFFLLSFSTANATSLATTIVSPSTPNGWGAFLESGTNGAVTFVSGPATAPTGNGSARFVLGNSASGVALARQAYAGQRFDQITTLTYNTFKITGTPSTLDISLQFNVDYNLNDANTAWQGRLVHEPYFTTPLPDGVWNSVDALAGEWWATGAPGNGTCPQSNPCTWAELLTAFPNAGVQTGGLAAVLFKIGSGPASFDGNVDNFHIVTSGGVDDTYDFENDVAAPGPACTTTCYVSTLGNDTNGGASAGDPLRNIQTGITNVSTGGTVIVAAGSYFEALTVNKWLTLEGAGSGTNPAVDTIITPATPSLTSLNVTVGGNSATDRSIFRDFRLTRAVAPTGLPSETGTGIALPGVSYLTFENVASVWNGAYGVSVSGTGADHLFQNVTLSGNYSSGWRSSSMTSINGVTFEDSLIAASGQIGLATGGGTNSANHNNFVLRNTTFDGNGTRSFAGSQLGFGDISFFKYNGNLTIEDVTVTGMPVNGPHIGVQLRGSDGAGGSLPLGPSGTVIIDNLDISGNYRRPSLATSNPGGPGNSLRIQDYAAGSSISFNDLTIQSGSQSIGMAVLGQSTTYNLGNADFTGSLAVIAIEGSGANTTGASNLTATGISVNGVSAATATLPQLFAIEDLIYHRIDSGTPINVNQSIGLVRVRANNIYVTTNSFLAPFTATPSIQRGVAAASAGDTVNVGAGTFNEAVTIDKSLTLDGVGAGTNPATHTILDGNSPSATTGNGITLNSGVTNVTIQDLRVQEYGSAAPGGSGIHGTGGNNNTTIQRTELVDNNLSNAVNGGGLYMNGPVSNVTIDDNDAINNRSRGIVIWNGFKQDITITNNYVANNICCGIELQDGTASGVTVTGNTVINNGDSGMAFIGLTDGAGPNLIANNTITNNGRFGIEIKLPDGNGTDTGDGSIVIETNQISRTLPIGGELRDLAGISVYRRGWVSGNGNVDIPTGVIVRNNTVNGYQQPSTSDGFGIVVEGVNHEVTGNTLNNNDVGVQAQGGHLPYTPNSNVDGDQSNLADQYFGRGNAPIGCPVTISGNTFAGNTADTRFVGPAGGYRATNIDTSEQFCTIQAAINDADTLDGHTIQVVAGTHIESLNITKAITLEGVQAGVLAKDRVGAESILRWSGNTPPISLSDDNITIDGFVLNGQGANTSWIINGVSEPNNGVYNNISILNNEFIGDAGPHTAQNDPGGVYMIASTNALFEGNYFNELGSHAVFMAQTSNGTTYRNNDSYRNYLSGFSAHTGSHTNVLVENNRAIEDSMILFNLDGAVIQNNVFTATATTSARIYLGGGSSAITVDGNHFNGSRAAAMSIFDAGFGYGGNSNVTVTDNIITATVGVLTFTDVGLIDLRDTTGTNLVRGNVVTMQGGTLGVNSVRGISLRNNMGTTMITANTLTGNNVDNSPATPSSGVYLEGTLPATSNTTIRNNVINGWNSGVTGGTLAAGLTATVYENDLSGNSPDAVVNGGGAMVNASANWYGTNTPAGVDALVSANVDYTPWFNVGTDTSGAAGWQGDFNWLNADDNSPQTGATGRINEAITLVTTGGTVNLAAGSYNETATVPKSLTLQGAGATTILDGNSPSATTGNGITLNSGVTNVTIQDLRVQEYGGTGLGSGIYGIGANNNTTVQRTELVDNNLSNLGNGAGLYLTGPVSNVLIDDNDAVNNRTRGIVIWDGFKQNITITNNYVANNICCGIELQDGTATGVTITGNIVENNGDSGMAFIGLRGPGANLIANNTVTNNGRFGIEIKLPDGNGTLSGGGSIVVEDNIISRSSVPADARDLAGISVYRRGFVVGNGNVDIPTGVIVRDNTVSGYQQTTSSDGFGIVVEGVNHQVTNNTLNNNDVGVQVQGGHLPYTPNTNIDGDQSNLNDQFFGRGNAPYGCAAVSGNVFSGNTTNTRSIGNGGAGIRATNLNTSETFCTIQAAIDDSQTLNGHTIEVEPGIHVEQIELYKELTIQGDGEGSTTIQAPPTLTSDIVAGYTNFAVLYVRDVNTATITGLTIDFNYNAEAYSVGYPEGVLIDNAGVEFNQVSILNVISTNPANYGLQLGEGVYACNDTVSNTPLTVTFDDVTVNNFQKNGLTLDCEDLNAVVVNSSFTGLGNSNIIAQNGVQLGGGATGTITDNSFSAISYTPSNFYGSGVILFDNGAPVLVEDNTFTNTQAGVYAFDTEVNVSSNTINYTAMGGTLDYAGVIIESATAAPFAPATQRVQAIRDMALRSEQPNLLARSSTVTENTLTGTGIGVGVWLNADAPESTNVQIFRNSITGFGSGVVIDGVATLTTSVTENFITNNGYGVRYYNGNATIYQNSITGSTTLAVEHANFPSVSTVPNASANWYGTNTPAGVDALVSANVDYTPWFNVGTDTNGGTAGWQGDFSWFNADDNSPQTGATGRINEAITLVTTGGTVNLAAGSYNETATVPKSLTLQGAGNTTVLDGNSPASTTGNGITLNSGVTNVTIQDLRVQEYGSAAPGGSGIHGTGGNNNTTIQRTELVDNNLSNAANGGGLYMNGPVSNVTIDDNDAINNRSRGIVIWNGFKQDITITNNYVANNICCGIELQDGTASGVTVTGNTVINNGDSGMAFIGLTDGAGPNLIANNTITNNGRFGIEIKLPDGNGTDTGDGSIVIEDNTVSRPSVPADARDLAGISVYRRGWVSGNGNVDIPTGVIVRDNTVSGYQQTTTSDGFGIVVEGVNHQVTNNTLNNNDVGVQVQGGHLPYTPNTNIDGDQSNLNDQFFGRGNAPYGCAAVSGNIFSGNSTNTRSVGNGGAGIRATNLNTSETFCTIQAAIDDSNTIAGHTIEVAAGTFEEQVEVYKAITLEGQGEGVTTIVAPLDMPDFFNSGADNNYPILYVHDVNATIRDLTVDGDGRGNLNYRFFGVAFEQAGGTLENVTITGMTETPFNGNQHGNGIWGRANNGTARTLTVTDVTITDFQKNGTVFTGANLTVTMDDSTVIGSGPLGLGMPAQNGIQLSGSATGSFDNNTISDIVYTPATFAATGYIINGAAGTVNITNSDITNTTTAIYYINTQGNLTDNTIINTPAGMGSAVYWWGAIVYNTTAAPLTAENKPALPDAVDTGEETFVPESALLNRSYTIEGNTFTGGGGGDGLSVYADAPEVATVTINENSVDDWAVGVYLDGAGTLNATVTASSVTNSDVGIQSERGTVSITNNVINNNGTGVLVSGAGTIAPLIYENAISSTGLGVNKTAAGIALINASANWWGINTPAGVAGEVSTGVDYTPWFNVGTDTSGTAGWQGDFSWFNADDNSPQTGATGRINEAITLVTTGGTVNLAAGTYNETATVPKSLTLQGAGATTILDGDSPSATTGNGITLNSGVTNVTIQDLRVQDYGIAAPGGSGIFGTLSNHNTIVRRTELVNNNLSNASNGGGLYMNGPVNNVTIDDNDAINNRSRGIVIWNGLKTNITITNNYVADNICCGIELQDGTASGVTVTGNTVINNGDSGMAFIGLQGGSGANLIANNTVTNNGRFGIEIKLPNGNGATSGDGSIVVENNTVSRNVAIPGSEQRDLAGISVYRRGWLAGNVDIPVGVIVRNNTVSGYAQPTTSDGFGIVVEGTNHQVLNNTLNNNDVGVQVQGGHLPYTPNTSTDGDQSNLNDQFFGRGNAPLGCAITTGNIFSGNTTDTRSVGNGGTGIRATNSNTLEQFCTIQAAIDDADTLAGHTIQIGAGTWEEQLEVPKSITLQGASQATTILRSPVTLTKFFVTSANNYPVIYIHDTANVTVTNLTVDGAGRGNGNARFIGIGYRNAGGSVSNVTVQDVRETPISGNQSGIGIYAFADNGTARTLSVNNATIFGFQKNGTAFNGANLTATMSNSTVTGAGPINFNAQNGIQLAFGANGSFTNNTISNVGYTPTTDNASGYLLYQAAGTTSITNSDLEDVEVGAYAYDSAMTFNGNVITQTTAGMSGMPTWFGVFIASDVPAPLAPNATVQPVEDGNTASVAGAMMNRSHMLNGNTMTSEGRVGTAIGTDVDALEVTSLNILTNTLSTWDVGIEFDGDGSLAAMVDDSYIYNNAVGVVIRTGVISILNGAITEGGVGIRYFDSDGVEPEVHGNDIDYNSSWGIEHATFGSQSTPTIVDATSNYWGDITGPEDTHLPNDAPCTTLGEYNPTSTGNPVTECVKWGPPLEVTLANFEATARANDILVTWETASETDNLGFNLYRATTPDGTPEQLNGELIPSQAPGGGGAFYEWEDVNVEVGVTYFYWLEAVDIQGNGSPYFGPVSATYGAPTAVTLSTLNVQPATLPMLIAAGLVLFGAVGVVIVRRKRH